MNWQTTLTLGPPYISAPSNRCLRCVAQHSILLKLGFVQLGVFLSGLTFVNICHSAYLTTSLIMTQSEFRQDFGLQKL